METTLSHHESWTIDLVPGPGDNWPDIEVPEYQRSQGDTMMRVTKIRIEVHRGARHPAYAALGCNVRKDGTAGLRAHSRFGAGLPGWARDICVKARLDNGITEELTGVPL